jgi:transposase
MLAETIDHLPPIIVHRQTMRVIDGTHRLSAATVVGRSTIAVRFFEGTEQEAFLLAVQANTTHGLPLSTVERSRAAEHILRSYPEWSDRAVAQAAGLGAKSVATIRRRIEPVREDGARQVRTGRDGRVRPLDNVEGRLKASALIQERPGASLREIARDAGVSPSTVRDVRIRLERQEDPIPGGRRQPADPPSAATAQQHGEAVVASMLKGLRNDPSLRFSESGRQVLRWIYSRVIQPQERLGVADQVPEHCASLVAKLARKSADEWLQLASELEHRQSG